MPNPALATIGYEKAPFAAFTPPPPAARRQRVIAVRTLPLPRPPVDRLPRPPPAQAPPSPPINHLPRPSPIHHEPPPLHEPALGPPQPRPQRRHVLRPPYPPRRMLRVVLRPQCLPPHVDPA